MQEDLNYVFLPQQGHLYLWEITVKEGKEGFHAALH